MFGLVEANELGARLASIDVRALMTEDQFEFVLAVTKVVSFGSLAQARGMASLHSSGAAESRFGVKAATWLSREAFVPRGTAERAVRVGLALHARYTEFDLAVGDGVISFDCAAELVRASNPRIEAGLEAMQTYLLEFAEGRTFGAWRTELISVANVLDQDGGHDPARDVDRNELFVNDTADGVTHISARLVGEPALVFKAALVAATEARFLAIRRDAETTEAIGVPPSPTVRALALVDLVRAGGAVDLTASRPPRPEITLVINASDPTTVHDPNGVRLQDGTVRTLCCSADLVPLVVDKLGVPLDHGTRIPFATPEQKRALANRDGGCIFPGCEAPPWWTDAHHVRHRKHLGPTDTENLASLCRWHHGVTHRTGWQMHLADDGWAYWVTPLGERFWSQRHGRRRTGPPPTGEPPSRQQVA